MVSMDATAKLLLSTFSMEEVLSWPAWRFAEVTGDYSSLEKLLESGAVTYNKLNLTKSRLDILESARSIMCILCRKGHLYLLKMALQHRPGLAAKAVEEESSMPLHVASRHGQPAAVRMLLNVGAGLEAARESDGWTALHEAAACGGGGGPVVAGVLLRAGARVVRRNKSGRTPLQLAAAEGHAATAQLLCSAGADRNAGEKVWSRRPLLLAAEAGSESTVRILLEAGAGVSTDQQGRTALLWAAEHGRSRAVTTLAAAGVDVNIRDKKQQTALQWAARCCDVGAVRALLEAGTNRNSADSFKTTPLHWAAWRGNASMVRLLLAGTEVDVRNSSAYTPLHYAAYNTDSAETARELLAAGADSNARDNWGRTPLHWAAEKGRLNIARLLVETTDVNATDKDGWTSLHCAASGGHAAVVRALLEAGADKAVKNKLGRKAYDLYQEELLELLK